MVTKDGHVVTGPGVIIWDGVTKPENKEDGAKVWSIKIAMPANAPEIAELQALAQTKLNEDPKFKGQLPDNGCWPILNIDVEKTDPSLAGCLTINAKTRLGCPTIVDKNAIPVNPLHLANLIYPGAKVKLVVNAYSFDNKSKGIAYNLDGIQIIDATLPKLAIAGGIDAAAAFAGFEIIAFRRDAANNTVNDTVTVTHVKVEEDKGWPIPFLPIFIVIILGALAVRVFWGLKRRS